MNCGLLQDKRIYPTHKRALGKLANPAKQF